MNMQHLIRYTKKPAVILSAALALATGCQKELDYTKPADANTFEEDQVTAFNNLTDGNTPIWAWGIKSSSFSSFFLQFYKDSTANIYSITTGGLVADLNTLIRSGTLTSSDSTIAKQLIRAFAGFEDGRLRELLEEAGNASFKNATQLLLPNYRGFNSLKSDTENVSFDINGPVQLSLTFHNSQLLASMKQAGTLDFDFRIMSTAADSMDLTGYYNDNSNRISTLYKMSSFRPDDFIAGSNLILAVNPLKAKVSLRTGGAAIPVPTDYNSGLDFFYRSFNQSFMPARGLVFSPNGNGSESMPDVLKPAEFVTVKSVFNGSPDTAPSGTVLITLTIHNKNGDGPDIMFVKD